ncbi:hypothetical protein [Escherichia albertii]|uniref:Polysaccharide pyruvyl transferase domain-containing protein n=1 Tax=Escherichia albertii TaxID=208962 RepID=A0A5A4U560_ESCAL|nr:hypothetical protein [Escherichia albertii]MCZ9036183.1 hypothetical protein [Escherichia albertii]BBM63187.1 predicted protein [Escherichia albertii]
MFNILFSEDERYYRALGLVDRIGYKYHFNGMKLYKRDCYELRKYDLFVCAFYTLPHNTILTTKFNSLGIKTVLVCDGIFDVSNSINNQMVKKYSLIQFFPIIQDYFVFPFNQEELIFNSKVEVVKYMPKRILSNTVKIPLPSENKILITTANTAYFTHKEFERLIELLNGIIHVLIDRKVDFCVRIFDDKILQKVKDIYPNAINDIYDSFEQTLERYTSVITTPSSIVITSMYHNRSVGQLIYRDTPQIMFSGWLFPSVDIFKSSFSEFYEQNVNRMLLQQSFIDGYLKNSNDLTEALSNIILHKNETHIKYIEHINQQQFNMLNSVFNVNFEFFVRKLYNKLKKKSSFKKIREFLR